MATEVIHEHNMAPAQDNSNALGFILGIVLLLALAIFALYYFGGLGRIGSGISTPQVNVPGKIDVNVNHQ